ncbi:aspartyl-phosphate phosphatase Spo0E family protein [Paenibacillus sp. P26]|nr:aspartyl-phosphate phosphatase Spo0E family protein [Paenibacillus sp. P26]UUZ89841.1 aspartyl-phosphate phosphatase Spo0E family protein [Paenibacillus sp. P25]
MLFSIHAELHSVISDEIERVRERMIRLGDQFGLMHPEVQQCSRQLDELLLKFYELDLKMKRKQRPLRTRP